MLNRRTGTIALALGIELVSSQALAQSEGFALDRFDPSERGSDWFVLDGLDLRGHLRPAVGVVGDYAHKPLVFYQDGEEVASVIEHQLFVHVGASLVLWERFRLGLNLPVLAYQTGDAGASMGLAMPPQNDMGLGDTRVALDARLFGDPAGPITSALGVAVYLPTGSERDYTGDGALRLAPRALAAGQFGQFAYGARIGYMHRLRDEAFAEETLGGEALLAVSAGIRTSDGRFTAGPELTAATVVTEEGAFLARRTTKLEVLLGAHGRLTDELRAGVGAGPGLSRGLGTPDLRVVASIEWHPEQKAPPSQPAPPPDRDGDGVSDAVDACPDEPGKPSADPRRDGCPPPPADADGDGIADAADACVDVPGVPTDDPTTHGCPPPLPDRDGDGIHDDLDACPDVSGAPSSEAGAHGCPAPIDSDGDTIADPVDACPNEPGEASDDKARHGCPKAVIKQGKIAILDRVEFESGQARILPQSEAVLQAVLQVLEQNPNLEKVSVEGHTDSRAPDDYNLRLSARRAAAVVAWLVERGIDKKRLVAQGFGESRPVDDNETEAGRQNNRRVEFRIIEDTNSPANGTEEKAP
jgi:outer membrane protein OmpA-like peptidoglycan-associated protein